MEIRFFTWVGLDIDPVCESLIVSFCQQEQQSKVEKLETCKETQIRWTDFMLERFSIKRHPKSSDRVHRNKSGLDTN